MSAFCSLVSKRCHLLNPSTCSRDGDVRVSVGYQVAVYLCSFPLIPSKLATMRLGESASFEIALPLGVAVVGVVLFL